MTDLHCPECGAYAHVTTDEDGDEVAVCPNDECTNIVVAVLSRPRVKGEQGK